MKKVSLYNEVSEETTILIVSNKQYNTLKDLEYKGGFKRFGLSLYDDRCKGKAETKNLVKFLCGVFVNRPLIENLFSKC